MKLTKIHDELLSAQDNKSTNNLVNLDRTIVNDTNVFQDIVNSGMRAILWDPPSC